MAELPGAADVEEASGRGSRQAEAAEAKHRSEARGQENSSSKERVPGESGRWMRKGFKRP